MSPKKLFLFLFLILLCGKASSAIFVVTSNADSGPGTLRDALTQAALADSTITNYINFNITDQSEAGRTITILSQLPDISSNLVVDGTTQPGNVFGVSAAKVALFFQTPADQPLAGLQIANKHDVAILGLYLKNFSIPVVPTSWLWEGINIFNCSNIQIGQAGKGNVVLGFPIPLLANSNDGLLHPTRNIALKSNFFDIDADGETLPAVTESMIQFAGVAGQIKVGGNADEGNILGNGINMGQGNSASSYDTVTAYFSIRNNKIGVDYNVKKAIPTCSGIMASTGNPFGANTIDIFDNIITSNGYAIYPINIGLKITILRNYIGTDKTLTQSFKTGGIFLYWDTGQVVVGSTDPADANYVTNCIPVQIWPFTNATVNKNSFYCVPYQTPMHLQTSGGGPFDPPVINILKISASSVSGMATPGSSVELFYSDKCGTCSPQTYFASFIADASGNWQYNGTITGTVIASATLGQNTSDFTKTAINTDHLEIINSCGSGTGSIKGIIPQSAANIKWIDVNGKVVGTSPDLLDVPLGKYKLLAQNGDCADSTNYFEIKNKFQIDTTNIVKTPPSCGNSQGSITGLSLINNDAGAPIVIWQDAANKVWGNSTELSSVPAGSYNLNVQSADGTCAQTYGPFILRNLTGPNIDQTKQNIQSTPCGQSSGSITNLTVTGTGTLKYIWWDNTQQTVGTDKDLLNQPAGTYKLQVTDDTQCGPIYTTDIVIPETNGITMDESKTQTTIAMCGLNNGSITGLKVTGATSYIWTNGANTTTTTTPDLLNMPPGDYVLTASNNFGCSKISQSYHIGQQLATKFPVYASLIMTSCFKGNDGWVEITTDSSVKSLRWVDGQGQNVGTNATLAGVGTGVYQLYLTDQNGCESFYNSYTVPEFPEYTVALYGTVTTDKCGLSTGAVSATTITGGLPPYTYQWRDVNNNPLAATNAITNLSAGSYILNVVDTRCGNVDITYTIPEDSENIPAPSVSNVQLCSAGNALLRVNNAGASVSYRLYDSPVSPHVVDEQRGGSFKVSVTANQSFYISQLNGTCESERAEVQVTVGLSAKDIVNTFTPNGDGINDYWKINSIESYPQANIQVFSRNGQLVFNSIGYAHPFDGTVNGKKLPAGVYYYVINLGTSCKILSGSLTILR